MAYDREEARKQLAKRQKESASKMGSGGFISVLKDDLPMWKAGEGKHKIDIIPYIVGKKHPTAKKGEIDYILNVWVHNNIGIDNGQYLCLYKMYDKPCPICEYRVQMQKEEGLELKDDRVKALQPKNNGLYNIICYDTPEQQQKGVQLWMINTYNMEDRLNELADDDSGERILFPDPFDGKTISFKRTGMAMNNTRYTAHAFVDRKEKIPSKLLEKAISLDECVIIPTYEEVEKAFLGGMKTKKKDNDDDNNDDDIVVAIPSADEIEDMTRKELKTLIKDLELDIDPDDDELEEKDALIEAVTKAVKKLSKGSKKKDDDDDDIPAKVDTDIPSIDDIEEMSRKELKTLIKDLELDIDPDDDDYEDKETLQKAVIKAAKKLKPSKEEKKKKSDDDDEDKKSITCPVKKGTFGEDFDKFSQCVDECDHFDACSDAYDDLKDRKDKSKGKTVVKRRK